MHLKTLYRAMNPHQRCLQDKVIDWNEPKSVYFSRSLEIKVIWTFDTGFPIKHWHILLLSLQLNTDNRVTITLGDKSVRLAKATTQDINLILYNIWSLLYIIFVLCCSNFKCYNLYQIKFLCSQISQLIHRVQKSISSPFSKCVMYK